MSVVPHYLYYIEGVIWGIITFGVTFIFFFWIFYLYKQLRRSIRDYKLYKYSNIYSVVRAKVLFNYETVICKDKMLILIMVVEFLFHVIFIIAVGIKHLIKNETDNNSSVCPFETCNQLNNSKVDWIVSVLHVYPIVSLVPIILVLIFISFIQLFSFLCTYLKRRYNGYNIDKRVVSKYAAWWCIQAVLLFLCAIPYTQILLAVMCPLLLFINWIVLVGESRSLSRAIQSVLYEIKHFECDDVRYNASYASYKTYRVFLRFQLIGLMIIIILISGVMMNHTIKLLLLTPCYFKDVYGISIHSISDDNLANTLSLIYFYFNFIAGILYSVILFVPCFILITPWLLHALIGRTSIRNYPVSFNYTQFQPLLVT